MTIFCPLCGKKLQSTREFHEVDGENFAYDCSCNAYHTIFVRCYKGNLRSVYFIDPLQFEEIWKSNQ